MNNSRKHLLKDKFLKGLIYFSAAVTVIILLLIIGYILVNGLPHVSWEFLSTEYSSSQEELHGILPMIINTLYIVIITLIFAVPIGILTAVYLTQYAKQGRLVKIIRFTTETLSGIPSIIFGLFGFAFFGAVCGLGYSILTGSLTLALMVLPTIMRTSEEALLAVPSAYKEGALALGAKKIRVVFGIVLPNAMSGILTSVILAMGRIVGESAALIFTSGLVYYMPDGVFSHIFDSGRTLTLHLYQLSMLGESMEDAYATAAVLLIIVFLLNRIASLFAKKLQKGKLD